MEIKISFADTNRRLDKFLFQYLNNASHSFIYKMLRKKRIKLNGTRAQGNELLAEGDIIKLYLSEETMQSFRKTRIIEPATPLTGIIFEDENLLIVNKPTGLASHGGALSDSHKANHDNLLARVLYYLYKSGAYNPSANFIPALCNRLDVNTSGLVVCGKNIHALQGINSLFANKGIRKEYLAIVDGILGSVGENVVLEGYYKKDSINNIATITTKKPNDLQSNEIIAITEYSVLQVVQISKNEHKTILSVSPITGRSHQIRAHFASIGHPLTGDKKYGGKPCKNHKNAPAQLLHCHRLTISKECSLPYPIGTFWETSEFDFSISSLKQYI